MARGFTAKGQYLIDTAQISWLADAFGVALVDEEGIELAQVVEDISSLPEDTVLSVRTLTNTTLREAEGGRVMADADDVTFHVPQGFTIGGMILFLNGPAGEAPIIAIYDELPEGAREGGASFLFRWHKEGLFSIGKYND